MYQRRDDRGRRQGEVQGSEKREPGESQGVGVGHEGVPQPPVHQRDEGAAAAAAGSTGK